MPANCPVCQAIPIREIERRMAAGADVPTLAEELGFEPHELARHKAYHMRGAALRVARAAVARKCVDSIRTGLEESAAAADYWEAMARKDRATALKRDELDVVPKIAQAAVQAIGAKTAALLACAKVAGLTDKAGHGVAIALPEIEAIRKLPTEELLREIEKDESGAFGEGATRA